MTRFQSHFFASVAALAITLLTMQAVVTVPADEVPAQAAALTAPLA